MLCNMITPHLALSIVCRCPGINLFLFDILTRKTFYIFLSILILFLSIFTKCIKFKENYVYFLYYIFRFYFTAIVVKEFNIDKNFRQFRFLEKVVS